MTRIYVQNVTPKSGISSVTFHDKVAANGSSQWLDTYGVIKSSEQLIANNVTVSSSTNGFSSGTVKVGAGVTVTVRGNWRVV
tara:strand:- start:412 stop:657 length:246 start_codon:yes stop_codon:yes gene_type:complete